MSSPALQATHFEEFDREGYLRLGRVVDDTQLSALSQRIDAIISGAVTYEGMVMEPYVPPEEGRVTTRFRKIGSLWSDDLFRDYIRQSLFEHAARHYYGPGAKLQRFMLFNNYPGEERAGISYHQDGGDSWNWMYTPHPILTVWLALDDADVANGCVHIYPRSHVALLPLADVPDWTEAHEPLPMELAAGEAVLLHNWTLHGSAPNRSDRPRRAITACFAPGNTVRTDGEDFPGPPVFSDA